MARNYAALPWEYLDEMDTLSDEEFGRLCRALLRYSAGLDVPVLMGNEKFIWKRVVIQEDKFQKSYNATAKSEAGRKGAAKRWHSMADDGKNGYIETNTKTDTKTNTKTDPSPVGDETAQRFCPPTVEEVTRYCESRGSRVDPQRFVDYYAARGWRAGSSPMRDWKAALRTWDSRDGIPPGGSGAAARNRPPDQRDLERLQRRLASMEAAECAKQPAPQLFAHSGQNGSL